MLVNGFYVSFEFFSNLLLHLTLHSSPRFSVPSNTIGGPAPSMTKAKSGVFAASLQAKAATTAHWARPRMTTKTNQHNDCDWSI